MENFPSNSRRVEGNKPAAKKAAPPPKKVEKVVKGEVTRRKKPLGRRFSETFVGGDAKSVWGYVMFDVMIPAAKDMVSDAVSQGVEKMLFGEVRGTTRGRRPSGTSGYTSYSRMSSGPIGVRREDPRQAISRRARATHNFDEFVLNTRAEAEEVIDGLYNIVAQYDVVTVADLYDMLDVTGEFTDEKWGWTDLRGAGISRVKGGYLLDLPKPEELD